MITRVFRTFGMSMLVAAAILVAADSAAPTQLQFLGTASIFAYNKHDKSLMMRQPNCSITQYSFYPVLALTPATNFQNTLHQLAGLTTTANKFAKGSKDPTLGIASTAAAYLGKTAAGAYLAVRGTIHSYSDLAVNAYTLSSLSFTSTTLASNVPPQVIGVDLNGDGFIDVVASGVTSPTTPQSGIGVFLSNGDGTFKPVVVYPMTTAANVSFIVDDVNGDGVPDIIVPTTSSGGANQLTTLIGKGDGSFTTGPSSPIAAIQVNELSQTLVTGDFNGDGKKDVLMADGNLYLGNGDGSFGAGKQVLPGNVYTNQNNSAFAVGDFNGDGKLDLAEEISTLTNGVLVVFLGNGDGTFTQGAAYEVVPHPAALVATDIDGDGFTDLVVARESNGVFSAAGDSWFYQVLMGYGNGTFNAAPVTLVGPFGSGGNGAIESVTQWPSTGIYALADFNADGHLDLLQPQPSGTNVGGATLKGLTVSPGNGDGSFGTAVVSATSFIPAIVAAADLNGDGKIDAVTVGTNVAGAVFVGVLFGSGGTSLTGELDYPLPAGSGIPARVVIGDFNGDGLPDIAVAIRGGPICGGCTSGVYVLFGQQAHTFTAPVRIDGSLQPIIATGDLNGDGRADLVVADAGLANLDPTKATPGVVHVYLGNADKSFTAATPVIPTLFFSDLALADINKDGKLDIVAGAEDAIGGNTMVVALAGDGAGGFGSATKTLITGGIADPPPVIAVADFDGDGNADVAFFLPGDFSGILFGIGNATFPTQVNMRVFSPIFPGAAMAVDLNGDKKPDLIFADGGQFGLISLINQWSVATSTAATTTTLTSSATSVVEGQSLTLTAMVAAASGGAALPTGSATFLDGSTTLGSDALDATGKATLTVSSLAVGGHSLSASYGGNTAFAGSASSPVTVQVTAAPSPGFSGSVNPASVTVAAGGSATLALTVTPLGGSTQTVTVSCGGLPANATCGFSPASSVTLDGSHASTVTITINTNVLAALRRSLRSPVLASFGGGLGGTLLLFGVMGAALRRRLRYALAAMGAVLALASCGGGHGGSGGSSGPVTPAGTYPLTITLTSGATTHTVSATLIVD
jgi:hypothetical protein